MKRSVLIIIAGLVALLASPALVAATSSAPAVQEAGGVVAVQAERAPAIGGWNARTTIAGYSGTAYHHNTATTSTVGTDILDYPVVITAGGTYQVQMRSRIAEGTSSTDANDSFVRVVNAGGTELTPVANNNVVTSAGWHKIYVNTLGQWTWQTSNRDHDPRALAYALTAGQTYRVQISRRSQGHAIDRVVLWDRARQDLSNVGTGQVSSVQNTALNAVADSANAGSVTPPQPSISGELKTWHKVTINVNGPSSSESSSVNPFRDVRLEVTFTAPNGASRTVPGYFAADGNAGETGATTGTVWRAHLTPDQTGVWTYRVALKSGTKVAINGGGTAAGSHDGVTGSFTITASDKTGGDFRAASRGQLDYVGEHALRWRGGGGRFFKVGMNHPEVFLEFQDFDNTDSTRTYAAHVGHWTSGDPTWRSGKGKGIIGVVNYLAAQGVNEHYFLTMNSRGDGKKAYPWTAAESVWNYDVSKLAQWGVVLDHMMLRGVMPHVVLDECENQVLFEYLEGTPSGGIADSRKLYYREMAARFGYLNAITWNIGEESGWARDTAAGAAATDGQRKSRAAWLRAQLSSAAHIVVHNGPSDTDAIFTPLLGDAGYSGISFQGNLSSTAHGNGRIGYWQTQSRSASRRWVIAYDEPYVGETPARDTWRINALWATLTGGAAGAGIYSSSDLSLQDYTTYAAHFGDMRRAATFLAANAVPFWDMMPANAAVSSGWCLAKAGNTYVVYLPTGGSANLTVPAGTYTVHWFDPRSDAALSRGADLVSTGAARTLGTAPNSTSADWVALVRLTTSTPVNTPPTVSAGPDRSITLPDTASLAGSVSDDGLPSGGSLARGWSKISGPGTVSFINATAASTSASFSLAGTYVLRLSASDGALSASDDMTVTVATATTVTSARINCGGAAIDPFGADAGFSGGSAYVGSGTVAISGVTNPAPAAAYLSERYGDFTYTVSGFAANQPVTVRLHFAEVYFTAVGQRVFDVTVNGALAVNDLDLCAVAGARQALVREIAATTNASGALSLGFVSVVNNAKVSAIEVVSGSPGGGSGLPAGWTASGIGGVTPAGSTMLSGSTWTVAGAGADIWDRSDQFYFARLPASGDVRLTVRVQSLSATHEWAKAGLMIRASNAADARHVSLFATPSNGVAFQRRLTTGGTSASTAGMLASAPVWLRLERIGTSVTAWQSTNGTTWSRLGEVTNDLGTSPLVGLAVTSHVSGVLSTAVFTDLDITLMPAGNG